MGCASAKPSASLLPLRLHVRHGSKTTRGRTTVPDHWEASARSPEAGSAPTYGRLFVKPTDPACRKRKDPPERGCEPLSPVPRLFAGRGGELRKAAPAGP